MLGLCQGGSIAVAYAARHPDRVRQLVLYDTYMHGVLGEGERFVSELRRFLAEEESLLPTQEDGFCELTPREREVLDLVAQGTGNRQIAERLFSPKTVRNHVTRISSCRSTGGRRPSFWPAKSASAGATSARPAATRMFP